MVTFGYRRKEWPSLSDIEGRWVESIEGKGGRREEREMGEGGEGCGRKEKEPGRALSM